MKKRRDTASDCFADNENPNTPRHEVQNSHVDGIPVREGVSTYSIVCDQPGNIQADRDC